MKSKKIQETLSYTQKALQSIGQVAQGNQELREAYGHLKMAMQKLEHHSQKAHKQSEINQTQAQQWWGTIVANTSQAKMSETAAVKTLKDLNAMISEEYKKLQELENKKTPDTSKTQTPSVSDLFFD